MTLRVPALSQPGSRGLALDIEHLWKFTLRDAPLEALLNQLRTLLSCVGAKLRHVHLAGYRPGSPEHLPMYCSREMVFRVLTVLDEACFQGMVVSEVNTDYQTATELRMDMLPFDAWREKHERILPDSLLRSEV